MGIEEYREQEISTRTSGIDPGQRERVAKRMAQEQAYTSAVKTYQRTATPLDERTREIVLERGGKERYLKGQELLDVAAEELVDEGYREEDIRTPFVELGGTPEAGFLPPHVQEKMYAEAGVVEEPVAEPMIFKEYPIVPVTRIEGKLNTAAKRLLFVGFVASIIGALKK